MKDIKLTEKEMITDGLWSQEEIATGYHNAVCCCMSNQLKQALLSVLSDVHDIRFDFLAAMSARGWVSEEDAKENEIAKIKQKYLN